MVAVPPAAAAQARRFVLAALGTFCAAALVIGGGNALLHLGSPWPSNAIEVNRLSPAYRQPTVGESFVYWKYRHFLAGDAGRPAQVVTFGDSSGLMGIIPAELERLTGKTAVNLGMDGSYSLGLSLRAMQDYLRRFGPPEVAVLHLAAFSTFQFGDTRQTYAYALLGQRHAAAERWIDTITRGAPAIYKAGVDLNARDFGKALSAWWSGAIPPAGKYPSDAEIGAIIAETRGFMRKPAGAPPTGARVMTPPELSTRNAEWLRQIFALAGQHDFTMLLVLNPVAEAHLAPETVIAHGKLVADLRGVARPFRRVVLAEPLLRIFPLELASDSGHLAGDGPERNTAMIAKFIEGAQTSRR